MSEAHPFTVFLHASVKAGSASIYGGNASIYGGCASVNGGGAQAEGVPSPARARSARSTSGPYRGALPAYCKPLPVPAYRNTYQRTVSPYPYQHTHQNYQHTVSPCPYRSTISRLAFYGNAARSVRYESGTLLLVLSPDLKGSKVKSAICLRAAYVMSAICLRACYAVSGTDLACSAICRRAAYAMSGTVVAHGTTRGGVNVIYLVLDYAVTRVAAAYAPPPYGCNASIYGSSASIYGSSASIYGSSASLYGRSASVCGDFVLGSAVTAAAYAIRIGLRA
eukprot:2625224-Rhodomonas_salina.3